MDRVTMADGAGGVSTQRLIDSLFAKYLGNDYLSQMEDATRVPGGAELALTTDSFVVTPIEFPGGNIGRLSVCGTVNDVLMSGAKPRYLTAGWILEEGLALSVLESCVRAMAETAKEAGVFVVAGDTKVIENRSGKEPGIMINTAGCGVFDEKHCPVSADLVKEGDVILLSGNLGDHHAALLGKRMGIENDIVSDNAPLSQMVEALEQAGVALHEMRDVTRGGLATVLHEFTSGSGKTFLLREEDLPVSAAVKSFAGILGLDPLYMGNEGKMVCIVDSRDTDRALSLIRSARYGKNAAVIGRVAKTEGTAPSVILETAAGGKRILGPLYGEGLPRIC